MLPLKDTVPSRSFPIVNWTLIAANVFAFVWQMRERGAKGWSPPSPSSPNASCWTSPTPTNT